MDMKEQIQLRLDQLKQEFELGQHKLREMEAQEAQLRQTLLRISGAIQVLEEELSKADGEQPGEQTQTADSAFVEVNHADSNR